MTWSGDGFVRLGRRHWRWRGSVPGAVHDVRGAALDAIKVMRPSSLIEPNASTFVARVGGTLAKSWMATEEITVVVNPLEGGGTDIVIESKSIQWSWTDSGRNRAAIERLLLNLGIR